MNILILFTLVTFSSLTRMTNITKVIQVTTGLTQVTSGLPQVTQVTLDDSEAQLRRGNAVGFVPAKSPAKKCIEDNDCDDEPPEPPECPEHCKDRHCKERCQCIPNIETIAFSPLKEVTYTENTVLVCEPNNKIKRLEIINNEYKYNNTCNGVVVTKAKYQKGVIRAVFASKKGDPHEETFHDIDIKDRYSLSHFNQGNSALWIRALIKNTVCSGDVLIGSAVWVAGDPINGCNFHGVNHWTGIFYKVEILGKCCSTCWLLQSAITSDEVITI